MRRVCTALLSDQSEHVRGWSIQLLCEGTPPAEETLAKFRELAKSDPSPVVRLYLAAALQRLPLAARWGIAEGLHSHPEDAEDANLPLMDWYGVEPLVPDRPGKDAPACGGGANSPDTTVHCPPLRG